LRTSAGYLVSTDTTPGREMLTVSAPAGQVCLQIRLLPEGPVLEVQGQALRFVAEGELRLECDRLSIDARREISLRTGALNQTITGDARLYATGIIEQEGHTQKLRAHTGDLQLSSNDDVSLDGERILLNSPKELPPAAAPQLQPLK